MMTPDELRSLRPDAVLIYNDGRPGHTSAKATVLDVLRTGLRVQFQDRADSTTIKFTDKAWTEHLVKAE